MLYARDVITRLMYCSLQGGQAGRLARPSLLGRLEAHLPWALGSSQVPKGWAAWEELPHRMDNRQAKLPNKQ